MTLVQSEPKKLYIRVDEQWWQPWANTMAYYPLDSTNTVNDMKGSWTAYNLVNSNITFWVYQWVDCAYFNSANSKSWLYYNLSTQIIPNTAFTWNCWMYKISNSSYNPRLCSSYSGNPYWILMNSSWKIVLWSTSSTNWYDIPAWVRVMFTVTWSFSNWQFSIYENSIPVKTVSWTWYNNGYWLNIGWLDANGSSSETSDKFNWYMSRWILENKIWQQDEITNYFLSTKSLYWIN